MKNKLRRFALPFCAIALLAAGCETAPPAVAGDGQVQQRTSNVKAQENGLTVEQENVQRRVEEDNKPGSIKFLYVISQTGDVLIQSTVKGKVTSGGKRLVPTAVKAEAEMMSSEWLGQQVWVGEHAHVTEEVMGEDGCYGRSGDYFFWFTPDGRYHQCYPGQATVLITDQPGLSPTKATFNLRARH